MTALVLAALYAAGGVLVGRHVARIEPLAWDSNDPNDTAALGIVVLLWPLFALILAFSFIGRLLIGVKDDR